MAAASDGRGMSTHTCPDPDCDRAFLYPETLADHAAAVHTFGEARSLVQAALREKLTPAPGPIGPEVRVWIYVEEQTAEWAVFIVEGITESSQLWKVDYSIAEDNTVTLGEPVSVIRRVVYEPVG